MLNTDKYIKNEENDKDEFENSKIVLLDNVLERNLYGCDLILCLFMSALQSYRVDRCLRPFPPKHIINSNKDVDGLRDLCQSLPPLKDVVGNASLCSNNLIELLVWLFCSEDQPSLKRINYSDVNVPSKLQKSYQPHFIYEIIYPKKTVELWYRRKGSRKSFLGYHGSQLDNFYSILKVGLQQNVSTAKELLYGKGIYLTSEITLSMNYAPFGCSWNNSIQGNKHSVIALCEVIDDIEKVKCKDENCKRRAVNEGSLSGNIPDKYFVVTDSDMVRLKYLFVYKEKSLHPTFWTFGRITIFFICSYVILLILVGFFQSPTGLRLQRQISKLLYSK